MRDALQASPHPAAGSEIDLPIHTSQWILRSFLSPGDILMLTAAVRDLHRSFPGRYRTDVRTSCPALWENNPHLTALEEQNAAATLVDCHYPLIQDANHSARHFLHGYLEFLQARLQPPGQIRLSAFKPDLHLTLAERSGPSAVARLAGQDLPYWVLAAGGKYDYTIKWWQYQRYQAVVDHFRDQLLFVQVGAAGHFHPELRGVLDFRGATDLRQLVRLVYHAQGVLCPVTFLMHLAAAFDKPCVVVAGGREPPHWEAYPGHQFIHTVGALPCCAQAGCWRSRTLPLGDGDKKDQPGSLCLDVRDDLPRCMDLITAEAVSQRIDLYLQGQTARRLTRPEAAIARKLVKPRLRTLFALPEVS